MTPSRWQAVVAGVILAAALAWGLWPRGPSAADAPAAENSAEPPAVAPAPAAPGGAGFAGSALREAVVQSGAPGSTPALQKAASQEDGFVEVRVLAQGKPRPGAHVRLYLKGRTDPNTAQIDWRFAGAADSGAAGMARIAARPGVYLLAARSETFAPARLEFQRPTGEPVTSVSVELQPGVSLSGRTLQKGTQEPVPLALVVLTWESSRRASVPAEEQARATSDARGKFRIDGLAKGHYRASAQAAGYAKSALRIDAQASKEIVVELSAASFIEGQVLAADGSKAAGAQVSATGDDSGEDEVAVAASETGSFSLEVSPRSWRLTARRGSEAGRAAAPVTVAAGATARGVKIQLGAASGLSGLVVAAASQQPVAGAQIAVSPYGASGDSGRAVSDGSGAFKVSGLAPGSYDVAVSADGFTDQARRGVTVQPGQQFPLRVELRRTGALEGQVLDSAGRPVPYALVRSARAGFGGAPAPPVEARSDENGAYRLGGLASGAGSFTALRDGSALGATLSADIPEGGTARLDFRLKDEGVVTGRVRRKDGSPPPPEASVVAMPGGPSTDDTAYLPIDAAGVYLGSLPAGAYSLFPLGSAGGFRGRTFVAVEAGKTATRDLTYADAAEDEQGFGGTVLEPDGTPSPGAFVRAGGGHISFARSFAIETDEQGRFHLSRPRADLADSLEIVATNGGRSGKTTVPPGLSEVTVQLQPAAALRGHVSGGGTDSFRVDLGSQSLEFAGERFELRDLPALPVRVTVTNRDGCSATIDLTLAPGETRDIEVELQPPAQVRGRLVDAATHQALPAVTISLDRGDNTVTSADGRFSLRAPAGDHALYAYLPRYQPLAKDFTAEAGEQLDMGDVVVKPLAAKSGTVGMQLRGDSETDVTVVFLIPDGPAEKAGVQLGDQIAAVDGKPVASVSDASARIQGPPGVPVQLSLRRSGSALSVTVVRAP